jgi:hypothetical protein
METVSCGLTTGSIISASQSPNEHPDSRSVFCELVAYVSENNCSSNSSTIGLGATKETARGTVANGGGNTRFLDGVCKLWCISGSFPVLNIVDRVVLPFQASAVETPTSEFEKGMCSEPASDCSLGLLRSTEHGWLLFEPLSEVWISSNMAFDLSDSSNE